MDIGSEGVTVRGPAQFFSTVGLPAACVGDTQIDPSNPVKVANLQHQYQPVYGQERNTTVVSATSPLWWAYGGGGVIGEFKAKLHVANIGAATVTVDLQKNGVSVLSAPISFGSGDAADAEKTATLSVTTYAAGDKLDVVVTATAGGGTVGKGLTARALLKENAA